MEKSQEITALMQQLYEAMGRGNVHPIKDTPLKKCRWRAEIAN